MDTLSQFKYSHDGPFSNTIKTKRNKLIMIVVIKMGTEKPIVYNQSECGTSHNDETHYMDLYTHMVSLFNESI